MLMLVPAQNQVDGREVRGQPFVVGLGQMGQSNQHIHLLRQQRHLFRCGCLPIHINKGHLGQSDGFGQPKDPHPDFIALGIASSKDGVLLHPTLPGGKGRAIWRKKIAGDDREVGFGQPLGKLGVVDCVDLVIAEGHIIHTHPVHHRHSLLAVQPFAVHHSRAQPRGIVEIAAKKETGVGILLGQSLAQPSHPCQPAQPPPADRDNFVHIVEVEQRQMDGCSHCVRFYLSDFHLSIPKPIVKSH